MPGEGGAGTHRHQSWGAINDKDKDAASKNDGNHNVVFFAMAMVGAYDVVGGGNGRSDSGSGSWLQLVAGWGVPEEEDQMMSWWAEPGGACVTLWYFGTYFIYLLLSLQASQAMITEVAFHLVPDIKI